MMNYQLIQNLNSTKHYCPLQPKPSSFLSSHGKTSQLPFPKHHQPFPTKKYCKSNIIRASLRDYIPLPGLKHGTEKTVEVEATVTFKLGVTKDVGLPSLLTPVLELVSAELDPETGLEKARIKSYLQYFVLPLGFHNKLKAKFTVPAGFGEVGAVLLDNPFATQEMYIDEIVLEGFASGTIKLPGDSVVHPKQDKRVFFTNKSYLPSETPNGLQKLRTKELKDLRGNGQGQRESFERIYDYDTYNDLGDPDKSDDLARPVLGGAVHPYPRRCRTGRPPTKMDPSSESRSSSVYVPRDEAFSAVKQTSFGVNTVKAVLHSLLPGLEAFLEDPKEGFPNFRSIDSLFKQGIELPTHLVELLKSILPWLVRSVRQGSDELLRFDAPELIERDPFSWNRDEEFSRQTLAGLNPFAIQLVTEWPLTSKLDSQIYGPPESVITAEIVEEQIGNVMTLNEALEQKRLFMLDYHDILLPYVNKVRELQDTTLYGSRTVFFLTDKGVLTPVAIELTRPPVDGKPQWKHVFTPSVDPTKDWLWRLAKAHVCAHDSAHHQLVSHWLRTHCCIEPYIIAANRQLSAMHPIYRLLKPHFRYTMEINALARQSLINAGGIIESTFGAGKYSIELSSYAYDKLWRFDHEALPADLIARGMAVEDPTAEHGLKLTIDDYPYAKDGLLLWDAIKQWVSDCVKHYYPEASKVEADEELQAWWTEVRTRGHADKRDEPWWPVLKNQDDLIQVVTTIIWVAAGHHAAVNFGQYAYGGYFPNRPTIARSPMPNEKVPESEFKAFLKNPEATLLRCFPQQLQALKVMLILNVLSSHSPDEEYIGDNLEAYWEDEPIIKAAFERFNAKLKELDQATVDSRNNDLDLRNRSGAGIVPYQLLKPFSPSGVTGMGVPNSISI
ncbi:Lipoxygenase 2, chloroplastic [Turnera subulata]|uniref:Lipoxygenase n=1 Tax=Turnera subulata TaxID=218843 RepID=A0A9Q0J9Y1_9ROSI|nr:Lipoxygenase 2, chloroplastic [Turnera subulata]